jgi:hypothetical protein
MVVQRIEVLSAPLDNGRENSLASPSKHAHYPIAFGYVSNDARYNTKCLDEKIA